MESDSEEDTPTDSYLNLIRFQNLLSRCSLINLSHQNLFQSYFQNGTFSPSTTSEIVADDDDDDVLRRHLLSLSTVMNRFSRPPLAIESEVVHTTLRYKGYVDCVTKYVNGGLVLVDWKTSKQPKSTLSATFDAPIQ